MCSIEVIQHSDHVEEQLQRLSSVLGPDMVLYRGHLYRVLTYTMHFLQGDSAFRPEIETALVYHDIGIWSHSTLRYLEPSEQLVRQHSEEHGWNLDMDLTCAIIHWHHKIMPYRGDHADVVNAFRMADWVDATRGRIRMGLDRAVIRTVNESIPHQGFYDKLQSVPADIGRNRVAALFDLLRVFKL